MRVQHTDLSPGRVHDRRWGQNIFVCELSFPDSPWRALTRIYRRVAALLLSIGCCQIFTCSTYRRSLGQNWNHPQMPWFLALAIFTVQTHVSFCVAIRDVFISHTVSGNNHLVIFGGMGYKATEGSFGTLCVLNDVCFYSLAESRWLPADETPSSPLPSQSLVPRARYAHLSSVSSDMLVIIGGQDLENGWLDDIHVYNLSSRSWVHRSDYPRHCGTYRSVALSSPLCVRNPTSEPVPGPAPRFRSETAPSALPVTSPDTFVQLPYSTSPSSSFPSEIFLYSNYNVSFLFVCFL